MTEIEFRKLLKLDKVFIKPENIKLPTKGMYRVYNLKSNSTKDEFLLDADRRGKIELSKIKLQTRYSTKQPLVRIDIDSPPHTNPDGEKLSRNHIHVFRETEDELFILPWAYDLETFPDIKFDAKNIVFTEIFIEFCKYCNINTSNIQGVM